MRILSTSEFAIRESSPYTDTTSAASELLLDGEPSGVVVTGAILEAAVAWHECRIAFFTSDIPFEEVLRIYMFDDAMQLIDAARLGMMYSTGIFAELEPQPPDTLTFRFFNNSVWRMTLLGEREFAFPVVSDPIGVGRAFKFFRHFRIEEQPMSPAHD